MKTHLIVFALLAGGVLSDAPRAQQQSQCPDMDVRFVKADYDMAKTGDRCGITLTFDWGGLKVSTTAGFCPLFVIFYPAHNEPVLRPDSKTYVLQRNAEPVKRVDYACEGGFLFFSRSSCTKTAESDVGSVSNYELRPCAELDKAVTVDT